MGKRELLLIAAFMIVGAVVYQVTAPPPAPGERSFSLSQLLANVRREVRGNRASAEATTTVTHAVPASVTDLRLTLGRLDVTITGEDRDDIAAELHVRSTGYDVPEAERLARETTLKLDDAGASILARMAFPEDGRQTATMTLKVPARLAIRLDPGSGDTKISNVGAVELMNARGETQVANVADRVTATQTGGELRVTDAGSVKITTRGSDATLERIRGESVLSFRNGEVKAVKLGGPIELETNGTDVTFEQMEAASGMFRANIVNGAIVLRGLRSEARIDARNAEVTVDVDRPAPLSVYAEGEDTVTLTVPAGGYQLDALAQRADITVPEGTVTPTVDGEAHRASGAVGGGGPTITIRTTRGDIVIKARGK